MSGVTIHLPRDGQRNRGGCGHGVENGGHVEARGQGAAPVTLRLGPGGRRPVRARFGDTPVEVRLGDPAVSRLAGEIRVTEDHWQLSNFSATQSYLVENPEGAGEYLRVPPRRAGAPIPFEFARVVLPTRGSTVSFQVFAPDHVYLDADHAQLAGGRWGTQTLVAYSLDETATYFLILVALCEPRLRDESVIAVPTTPQIVERLRNCRGTAGSPPAPSAPTSTTSPRRSSGWSPSPRRTRGPAPAATASARRSSGSHSASDWSARSTWVCCLRAWRKAYG